MSTPIPTARYLDWLRSDGDAFVAAVEAGDLDAGVASCPGWSVRDLAHHMGMIWAWVDIIVGSRARARVDFPSVDLVDADLPAWLRSTLDALLEALAEADPTEPIWGWAGSGVGFWARRMAHETAVHRWDAESSTDAPDPLPAELAVDGIDEFLELLGHRQAARRIPDSGATIHLHSTDADGEWLITLTGADFSVTHEHAKGDAAARAKASDLDLWLWGRVGHERLDVFGDKAILDEFGVAAHW